MYNVYILFIQPHFPMISTTLQSYMFYTIIMFIIDIYQWYLVHPIAQHFKHVSRYSCKKKVSMQLTTSY